MLKTFKGAQSEYRMLHYWVEKQLGKPSLCTKCGRTDKDVAYDWSNISGKYLKDITDWRRLCHKCHMEIDLKKEVCKRGHPLEGENLFFYKNYRPVPGVSRGCYKCKLFYRRKYKEEKRLLRKRINERKPND